MIFIIFFRPGLLNRFQQYCSEAAKRCELLWLFVLLDKNEALWSPPASWSSNNVFASATEGWSFEKNNNTTPGNVKSYKTTLPNTSHRLVACKQQG